LLFLITFSFNAFLLYLSREPVSTSIAKVLLLIWKTISGVLWFILAFFFMSARGGSYSLGSIPIIFVITIIFLYFLWLFPFFIYWIVWGRKKNEQNK